MVRLAVLVLVLAGVVALFFAEELGSEQPCAAEDEVMVEVKGDAFQYQAGEAVCLHIDDLNEGVKP